MKGSDFIKRGPMMVGGSYVDGGPGEDDKVKKGKSSSDVNGSELNVSDIGEYGKNKRGDGDYKELKNKRAKRRNLDFGDKKQGYGAFRRKLKGERIKRSRSNKKSRGFGGGSMFGFSVDKCTGLNCKPRRVQRNLRVKSWKMQKKVLSH